MSESQPEREPLLRYEDVGATSVYPIIHMIRSDIMHFIDTPLSYEALTSPDITYTLVQPLVEKYLAIQHNGNMSVVFCLLLNRVHFIRDDNILTATISCSRAALCEILAIRTFRDYGNSMLNLTLTLTTTWPVYNGADPHIIRQARAERDDDLEDRVGNAIEMAILGKSKRFIKSSSCQKVINAIWTQKAVIPSFLTPINERLFISTILTKLPSLTIIGSPICIGIVAHTLIDSSFDRLKVPAIRSVLEYSNFVILFLLFIIAVEVSERDTLNTPEIVFMIYSLGFTLEKVAAMQEHGIKVYFNGTWNGFDLAFVTTFAIYAVLRLYGIHYDSAWARELGIDCLALTACLLFPRLAFVTLKDNLMVLSLRAMMMQFMVLMLIAAFCFFGFLYALWTLSRNQAGYSAGTIAWWMLDLWFGLDASGFDRATQFHPVFGPVLMVTYACLSNTLLLTVLVSILSNTFATINEDAAAEAMFRKAVSTIEGVKADSLFSYQPPINLIAVCVMLPANYILSPRWFHKVNVFMIRLTSFPVLLLIALYERQCKNNGTTNFYDTISAIAEKVFDTLPRHLKRLTFFEGLVGSDADINAIFEIEEDFESALDTNEGPSPYQYSQRPRRASSQSGPRPADTIGSTALSAAPRTRLSSLMHRGSDAHGFVSPLAQVFQPLVVDETIPEEPTDKSTPPPAPVPVPAVSYGPATRRRLSSMQSVWGQQPSPLIQANQMKKISLLPRKASPPALVTKSADSILAPESSPTSPETATQALSESEAEHAGEMWAQRLEEMERRQERIEDLLMQIARDVKRV